MTQKQLETKRIFEGRAVKLRVDTVKLPSGRKTTREVVEHNPCVAIVALDSDDVLLVRQFRYPVSKTLLEIPAGNIEAGEEAIQCARRELEEETGYTAQKIEDLGGFYSSPGFCDEFLHLYLATELQPSGTAIDADEIEKVVSVPLTDIPGLISSGEICDAKSIAGLLRVLLEKFET